MPDEKEGYYIKIKKENSVSNLLLSRRFLAWYNGRGRRLRLKEEEKLALELKLCLIRACTFSASNLQLTLSLSKNQHELVISVYAGSI